MKKRLIQLLGCLLAVNGTLLTVSAEPLEYDWTVTFDGSNHMSSTFKAEEIQEIVSDMQPGDEVTFNVTLKNASSNAADFWMDNMVAKSFEEGAVASNGAYTYTLEYIPNGGTAETLYTSELVGGDSVETANVGLHEAVNAFGDDQEYIYLENIPAQNQGTVRLYVALDGETQDNSYQNTIAQLALKFAAEIPPTTTTTPKEEVVVVRHEDRIVYLPNTGDESNTSLYLAAFAVSACVFIFAFLKLRKTTKEN